MSPGPDPSALKRTSAGSYRSADGRFSVQQASGRWLVVDSEQQDDLGLPLTRGPFTTLDAARGAIAEARDAPAPTSGLPDRISTLRRGGPPAASPRVARARSSRGASAAATRPGTPRAAAAQPRPEIATYRRGDGPKLRAFWATVGFRSIGDDDESLDRLAARNPGLVIVASTDDGVVGTALGAWDGRRGWIYHVAVAPSLRRTGLGRRLVHEVERRLRALGCPKVNVIVRDDDAGAARFWEALGYASPPARQFGKEL